MKIAIMHYHHKHGVDSILFKTNCDQVGQLPPITSVVLAEVGIDLEEGETVEWYDIRHDDSLPEIKNY